MTKTHIPDNLRQRLWNAKRLICCYCQSQQAVSGIKLTIDHIVPEALGGGTAVDNLCLACWECNLRKGQKITGIDPLTDNEQVLYHPHQQKWQDHFVWDESQVYILGVTAVGRATITALDLNRPHLIEARQRWVKAGWHPPKL
jgi:hypothetical protein